MRFYIETYPLNFIWKKHCLRWIMCFNHSLENCLVINLNNSIHSNNNKKINLNEISVQKLNEDNKLLNDEYPNQSVLNQRSQLMMIGMKEMKCQDNPIQTNCCINCIKQITPLLEILFPIILLSFSLIIIRKKTDNIIDYKSQKVNNFYLTPMF